MFYVQDWEFGFSFEYLAKENQNEQNYFTDNARRRAAMRLKILMATGGRTVACKLPGSVMLDSSVGYHGGNSRGDVIAIQSSLNSVLPSLGGAIEVLNEDGLAGPKTQNAILRFQTHWVKFRDSRIDPDGATLRALNGAVGAAFTGFPAGPLLQTASATTKPPQLAESDKLEYMKAAIRYGMVKTRWLPKTYQTVLSGIRIATKASAYAKTLPRPSIERNHPDRLAFLLVAKHFKLHEKSPQQAISGTNTVEMMCRRMGTTLANRVGNPMPGIKPGTDIIVSLWRTPKDVAGHPGYTWFGGAWERHRMMGSIHSGEEIGKLSPDYADRIYLTPLFDNADDEYRLHVLAHELAHFIGDMVGGWTLDDLGYAYEQRYANNSSIQRLHNADAYTCFIRECGVGTTRAVKGSQIYKSKAVSFGNGPNVAIPETPFLPPVPGSPAKDPFAYPSGY